MKHLRPTQRRTPSILLSLLLALVSAATGCGNRNSDASQARASGNLQEAIKARTEVTELQLEVVKTDKEILDLMRKVVAKADAKQSEGNILLTKDRYTDAVDAFKESARLYRQVADGKKLLGRLAKAGRNTATARMLAEATAKPDQLKEARRLETNAEAYVQAGEFEPALAEHEKARAAYAKLLPSEGVATLEQAVAARTAMQAARAQIKNLSPVASARGSAELRALRRRLGASSTDADSTSKEPKAGSFSDLVDRAHKAESAASDALEDRQYTPARSLFVAAEKLYREAATAQAKREAVMASRQSAEDTLKKADAAFKSSARPASFERGKQALADADKALGEDDLEAAKPLLVTAAEQFGAARAEADQMNALGEAQQAWSAALAAVDEELLKKHVAADFQAARAQAEAAQIQASSGQTVAATAQFKQAAAALASVAARANTLANAAKAAPVVARLESAVAVQDKLQAESTLAELEKLIPADSRMAGLRAKTAALPWGKTGTIDLGGGVQMELVFVRPGSFMMGSDAGSSDEKPVHKVTLAKPFYLGKFEVTQEQWQAVMGSNPSNFKGPKLPVENVSWNDCQSFLTKLQEKTGRKFALPTEAQWEYACRAGTTTRYSFGDSDASLAEYGWFSSNSGSTTHPVGERKPNPWGLYDMHGNVWEWCADWFASSYPSGDATDPQGALSGSSRVLRGGAWIGSAVALRSSFRSDLRPDYCYYRDIGLRCVMVMGEAAP